jgi:hypothetical protein
MLEELSLHPVRQPTNRERQAAFDATATSLTQLNLDYELLKRYQEAKEFLADVILDTDLPPNQVAQVMNTVATILKEIVKAQTDVHNAEKVKLMEQAMITALKTVPEEAQDLFFAEFERLSVKNDR